MTGLALALLAEALLILVVLTLGSAVSEPEKRPPALTSVAFRAPAAREAPTPKSDTKPVVHRHETSAPVTAPNLPQPVAPPSPLQPPPQVIRLSPKEMASTDIGALPRRPGPAVPANRPMMGPPDPGGSAGDTRVVGSAPNGEPLYAAAWYREPYDDELRGYLSTATGPGWGLIACRTAPDYRVEDCVSLDEYPTGSNLARAILAAAWQFKVRPPRVGGRDKVGEWVRIRIDYGIRRKQG